MILVVIGVALAGLTGVPGYLSSQLWLYLRQVSESQTETFIFHNNKDIQDPGKFQAFFS